ncbi:MAG: SH3 domain-containing protein [Chloroflexota bacterium]|nr:SH3 domain-containing protein [Chloroflexota bacterium]
MNSGEATRVMRAPRLMFIALVLLFSACSLGVPSAEVAPVAFSGPPVIRIASPLSDQTFLSGATVIVQARIENAGPDLARVSMLLDGDLLGEKQDPNPIGASVVPVTIDWPTSNPGQFEITVAAERGDGSGASESVSISVVPAPANEETQAPPEDVEVVPTVAEIVDATVVPLPEETAALGTNAPVLSATVPTATSPSALSSRSVAAVIAKPSNLRRGPGTSFELVGSIAVNQEVVIVAVNPDRDWYHIRYGDQGDAWIYSELVSPGGDLADLPVESGPAPAEPATAAPSAGGVNLVIAGIILEPRNLVCNQAGKVTVLIRNEGAEDTSDGGWIAVEDTIPGRDEPVAGSEPANPFPTIRAGETITAIPVNITVSAFTGELHRIVVSVDSGGHIAETNENDNSASIEYTLQRGSCP